MNMNADVYAKFGHSPGFDPPTKTLFTTKFNKQIWFGWVCASLNCSRIEFPASSKVRSDDRIDNVLLPEKGLGMLVVFCPSFLKEDITGKLSLFQEDLTCTSTILLSKPNAWRVALITGGLAEFCHVFVRTVYRSWFRTNLALNETWSSIPFYPVCWIWLRL